MKSNKEIIYSKLFKYVNEKYSDKNIEWYTDVETENDYIMRAYMPDGTKKSISINYKTEKITDEEVDSY